MSREALETVIHCGDVVDDLVNVMRQILDLRVEFHGKEVLERALCPLDLRAEHSLTPHIHGDEQIRIRHRLNDPVQPEVARKPLPGVSCRPGACRRRRRSGTETGTACSAGPLRALAPLRARVAAPPGAAAPRS